MCDVLGVGVGAPDAVDVGVEEPDAVGVGVAVVVGSPVGSGRRAGRRGARRRGRRRRRRGGHTARAGDRERVTVELVRLALVGRGLLLFRLRLGEGADQVPLRASNRVLEVLHRQVGELGLGEGVPDLRRPVGAETAAAQHGQLLG